MGISICKMMCMYSCTCGDCCYGPEYHINICRIWYGEISAHLGLPIKTIEVSKQQTKVRTLLVFVTTGTENHCWHSFLTYKCLAIGYSAWVQASPIHFQSTRPIRYPYRHRLPLFCCQNTHTQLAKHTHTHIHVHICGG